MSRRPVRTQNIVAFVTTVLFVCAVLMGVRALGLAQTLEFSAFDYAMRFLAPDDPLDPYVSVVGVTEGDIQSDRGWPLTDETLAELMATVAAGSPRAIGLDIYRDLPVPPGTARLEQLFRSDPRIIALYNVESENARGVAPPPVLAGSTRIGFNNIVVDSDGVVRRGLLFMDDANASDGVGYSLALRLALMYLAIEGVGPTEDPEGSDSLRLGETTFHPIDESHGAYVAADTAGYQYLLDYRKAARDFPTISLSALLRGEAPKDFFRDRVVLIGHTAESVPDRFRMALKSGSDVYGVKAHAYMTSQILRYALGQGSPIGTFSDTREALLTLIWAAMGAALGLWQLPTRGFVALAGTGAVAAWLLQLLALSQGIWTPIVSPVMAWLGSATILTAWTSRREAGDRAELMGLFSRHLTPSLAEHLWQQRDAFLEGGRLKPERLTVTILFLDLKGYTAVVERLEPEDMIAWINEVMIEMSQAALDSGGLIIDYFGDGMMAAFGAPISSQSDAEISRDAEAALTAARGMATAIGRLNENRQTEDNPKVGLRIGLCTGSVVAGSVGAADRVSYTLVGDTVITAQRLEAFDKDDHDFERNPTRILISETTRAYLESPVEAQYLGEFLLKGKTKPVGIYQIMEETKELDYSTEGQSK